MSKKTYELQKEILREKISHLEELKKTLIGKIEKYGEEIENINSKMEKLQKLLTVPEKSENSKTETEEVQTSDNNDAISKLKQDAERTQ